MAHRKLFIWQDSNAPSLYMTIIRRINTHLGISTEGGAKWSMTFKVYKKRTDLRKTTKYDAIADVVDASIMKDLMATELDVQLFDDQFQTLILASSSLEPEVMRAILSESKQLVLTASSIEAVEAILVPKKNPEYKYRQTARVEGIVVPGQDISVGLIYTGTDASGIWLETAADLSALSLRMEPDGLGLTGNFHDYVTALNSAKVI